MSRNKEYVNAAGLRLDGRRPGEFRPSSIEFGTLPGMDGSCTVLCGRSKVCASVVGPREVVNRLESRHDQAVVTCSVAIAAFAGERRRQAQRDTAQSEEISNVVVQVMRSIVLLPQYAGSQLHVYVEILSMDGSEKIASINAACLALMNANVAMRDVVCAINAAPLDNNILVDLTREEMLSQAPVLSVAMIGHDTKQLVWFESTGRISPDTLKKLIEEAQKCGTLMFESIKESLKQN